MSRLMVRRFGLTVLAFILPMMIGLWVVMNTAGLLTKDVKMLQQASNGDLDGFWHSLTNGRNFWTGQPELKKGG